jgi:lysophospholipase L1-like esterase
LLPDGVHFKPQGYAFLGKAVADQIKRVADENCNET